MGGLSTAPVLGDARKLVRHGTQVYVKLCIAIVTYFEMNATVEYELKFDATVT